MPCICDQCDLFAQVTCPRVSPDGKEMCLNFQGAQTNSLQQLKAEIAALIDWYDIPRELAIEQRTVNRAQLLERLRQLSAV